MQLLNEIVSECQLTHVKIFQDKQLHLLKIQYIVKDRNTFYSVNTSRSIKLIIVYCSVADQ